MKTIISHFYNEEFLLPFWLNHHKKYFDNGIMIDYDSTDRSVDIIKEICPNWTIIKSKNRDFGAHEVDDEINEIESTLLGWRIVLNTTEFLLGDFKSLDSIEDTELKNIFIPSYVMVDTKENEFKEVDPKVSLLEQRFNGTPPGAKRAARKLSNFYTWNPTGRHWDTYNTDKFVILWYGMSPLNEQMIKRKLQIQHRIPDRDRLTGAGWHHITNREDIIQEIISYRQNSVDLTEIIRKYSNF